MHFTCKQELKITAVKTGQDITTEPLTPLQLITSKGLATNKNKVIYDYVRLSNYIMSLKMKVTTYCNSYTVHMRWKYPQIKAESLYSFFHFNSYTLLWKHWNDKASSFDFAIQWRVLRPERSEMGMRSSHWCDVNQALHKSAKDKQLRAVSISLLLCTNDCLVIFLRPWHTWEMCSSFVGEWLSPNVIY